jgi:hypothetical protein
LPDNQRAWEDAFFRFWARARRHDRLKVRAVMRRVNFLFALAALVLLGGSPLLSAESKPSDKTPEVVPAPLPPVKELKLEPASLTLEDGLDARKVLVWAVTDSHGRLDLTTQASFKSDSACVEVDSEGYLLPKSAGEAKITVSAAGKQVTLPVKVKNAELPPIRFVRDIEPILSKTGCNAGTCHGSAKGKNGFKLSLRGYDPEFDYQALINDLSGRRFNRVDVDQSLMLLKPTAEVPHEGRQPIKPGSRYHQLLRQWIAQGVKFEPPQQARAQKLEVMPDQMEMDLPGRTQQMLVLAHYADGSVRDVTREVVFSTNNKDVAEVKDGVVTSIRRGEAAILMRYEGLYATKEVSVMGNRGGWAWNNPPQHNYIDKHIDAKLQKMKILPSDLCTDAEFIRRVTLDLIGIPPTPERVRAFLANKTDSKVKREQVIDELLDSPEYAKFWANKWADLLQCNSENLGKKGVAVFQKWIQESIASDKPYDQFVREILLAEGSSYLNPAVNYYRVLREPGKIAEDVSQTFLGVRFNCNKCHDHPFEKWTQNQYYEFAAYFARLNFKRGTLGKDVVRNFTGDNQTVTGEEIVYVKSDAGEVKHPKTDKDVAPKVPYGEAKETQADADRREAFVEWLTSKDNPYFGESMANRVWSYFFGRGIIDPVDDIRGSNPPSNAPLLAALTDHFIRDGFNVRKLMRAICVSRTYQTSIIPNKWNEDDQINFSHALPRRLSAEQLLDAVAICTGSKSKLPGLPVGMRSVDLPDGLVEGNDFLTLFGRPKRQSACECERTSNITLSHAMNLINGRMIGDALNAPENRLKKLVETEKEDKKVIEEIYYSVLNRPPTEEEFSAVDFAQGATRLETAQDLAWALMNSPAFLFNR